MKRWVRKIAVKAAISSTYHQFKHGAVIEKGGRILSQGTNALKIINQHALYPFSRHAEVSAITAASGADLEGATLYSARVTAIRIALAKPCPKCMLEIIASGIKEVVYSIDNFEWGVIDIP